MYKYIPRNTKLEIDHLKDQSVKIDLRSLEKLHTRINHYFKIFSNMYNMRSKLEEEVNFKMIEIGLV